MSAYTRDDKAFKESLSTRRDEIVVRSLEAVLPALAAESLFHARLHLHRTHGSLDAIVILFNAECAVRLEHSQD